MVRKIDGFDAGQPLYLLESNFRRLLQLALFAVGCGRYSKHLFTTTG